MTKSILVIPILLAIHVLLLINLRFTPWPEMLSFPYLISKGFTLYSDMVVVYPPFLVIVLSLVYKIFGYKIIVLKLFTWLLILLSDIFIYKIAKIVTKKDWPSIFGLASYVFLQPFLEGNMLWFDNFLVLPVLLSIYFLIKEKYIKAGLFIAMAVFSKQTALIYFLVAIIYTIFKTKNLKQTAKLAVPSVIFGILFLVYLLITNSFIDFINWNLIYPFRYWSSYPTYVQFVLKKVDYLILSALILPAGIVTIFNLKKLRNNKFLLLLLLMFVASLLAVYPRYSYYHLAVGIALSSVFYGIASLYVKKHKLLVIPIILFMFVYFWYQQRVVLAWDWQKSDRFYTQEEIMVSEHIQKNVDVDETVYLLNIHSGIYIYADRTPPKPWYDDFGWYLEIPDQQEKILNSWRKNPPMAIYWKMEGNGEWYLPGIYKPKDISNWVENNYMKTEEVIDGVWYWRKK